MVRPTEPFRALFDEARQADVSGGDMGDTPDVPNRAGFAPPLTLSARLDQLSLPGETPARPRPSLKAESRSQTVKRPRPSAQASTTAPAPATPAASPLVDRAPAPRMAALLEELTQPGRPARGTPFAASSSQSVKLADLYRLELDFEDTPARPLPKSAHLPPVDVEAKAEADVEPRTRPGMRLSELESIPDLEAVARSLGMRGVDDVSIPSLDADDFDEDIKTEIRPQMRLPASLTSESAHAVDGAEVSDASQSDTGAWAPPQRAAEQAPSAPVTDADEDQTPAYPRRRRQPALTAAHTAQPATPDQNPVIVRFVRPKVTAESRSQAHKLYLSAVDALARGDAKAAIANLRSAVEHDSSMPLYSELMLQLENQKKPAVTDEHTPALHVRMRDGQEKRPRDLR